MFGASNIGQIYSIFDSPWRFALRKRIIVELARYGIKTHKIRSLISKKGKQHRAIIHIFHMYPRQCEWLIILYGGVLLKFFDYI